MRQPPENCSSGRSWSCCEKPEPREHPARLGLERVLVRDVEVVLQLARAFQQCLEVRILGRDAGQALVQ
jgi:hypothetical protein